MYIKQFSIYSFDLSQDTISSADDFVYGVVLSPNEMNDCLKTVIIAPLCNKCSLTPTTFLIDEKTRIKLDQLTIVDKVAAIDYIDKLDYRKVTLVREILSDMFIKE